MSFEDVKDTISNVIDQASSSLRDISLKVHDHPELGNNEFHAYKILTEFLEGQGFHLTRKAAGMDTAFIAEFSNGSGRRIGFCSEYDALPGVGHGCGHNLIAISGIACALAMKRLLETGAVKGSVVLFGTPAEESTSGKIIFVNSGEVKRRVDVAMMLHPFALDGLYARMLALDTLVVEFFGRASHAGMAPWNGVNAVDAIMQGFDNLAMLRQQLLTSNRVHGIITNGGKAANVIPDFSSAKLYARALTRDQLAELKPKVENCFKGAAKSTGCQYKMYWAPYGPVDDVFMNAPLAECYKTFMEERGAKFLPRIDEENIHTGSTDMGNFSYEVPSIHPAFNIDTTATNHTKEFADAARTEKAHELTLRAAKCLAMTAANVYLSDNFYHDIVADFKKGKPQ
ncbi:hypothetical protein DM01DRAFT_1326141 [Hesseltinella vesiculosa]|uniref:Peptidase M20 domain-containing protein 2 n=1 Tax=Hesseltinella vesiculosa TaxID=101127 RepID=A0A1X2GA60_9FUNG|nr:hypothetical protein DM01DRAFT_1326141 [Hesseltinella vesiculosa]